jgi:LmbE family N-acetylglucosaminyl deacetylase
MDAADIQIALKKLTVLGSVLYVGAHPDDENTALLAYLARGRNFRTAYLSMTRGEGGQNLIGSDQGELMGIIRTQELLAARRIDGAEQFFTRAIDFGFSKSPEEALKVWNKEQVLSDVVWIIRKFRPDIIITRFSPTIGGHGHHTASAILAREAFIAAGDPSRFPEQLQELKPWKPKRIVFNLARFFDVPIDTVHSLSVDVGEYSPLLGKSFTEIAGISRSMHKSQGFGAAQTRGENVNYFEHTAGDSAKLELFEGIDLTWSRLKNGDQVGRILRQAADAYNAQKPSASLPELLKANVEMKKLPDDPWVSLKKNELLEVIKSCTGLWVDAISPDYSATPGSELSVKVTVLNRSHVQIRLEGIALTYRTADTLMNLPHLYNKPLSASLSIRLPRDMRYTQPYWLEEKPQTGTYTVSDRNLIGNAENPPALSARVTISIAGNAIAFDVPVQFRWVDPVEGELYRSIEIVPPVALNLDEKNYLFNTADAKKLTLKLHADISDANGMVQLFAPSGWSVDPASSPFSMKNKNDDQSVSFTIRPAHDSATLSSRVDEFTAAVTTPEGKSSLGIRTIQYSHIPRETLFPPAEGKLVMLQLHTVKRSIGYIMGSGDAVPGALRQMGYRVTLLSDEDLASGDLQMFETIIAGVRAYNTRHQLKIVQQRLMEYVKRGGTYLVQYVTPQKPESDDMGPYPFTIGRDRVTVEDAPVTFTDQADPLLNVPNRITQEDFQGWVQERGLYFAGKWDSTYRTVISSHDPGEQPLAGGLLVARSGKGNFVYTGYSFFRQLPAGVPGAFRLFANLVELR